MDPDCYGVLAGDDDGAGDEHGAETAENDDAVGGGGGGATTAGGASAHDGTRSNDGNRSYGSLTSRGSRSTAVSTGRRMSRKDSMSSFGSLSMIKVALGAAPLNLNCDDSSSDSDSADSYDGRRHTERDDVYDACARHLRKAALDDDYEAPRRRREQRRGSNQRPRLRRRPRRRSSREDGVAVQESGERAANKARTYRQQQGAGENSDPRRSTAAASRPRRSGAENNADEDENDPKVAKYRDLCVALASKLADATRALDAQNALIQKLAEDRGENGDGDGASARSGASASAASTSAATETSRRSSDGAASQRGAVAAAAATTAVVADPSRRISDGRGSIAAPSSLNRVGRKLERLAGSARDLMHGTVVSVEGWQGQNGAAAADDASSLVSGGSRSSRRSERSRSRVEANRSLRRQQYLDPRGRAQTDEPSTNRVNSVSTEAAESPSRPSYCGGGSGHDPNDPRLQSLAAIENHLASTLKLNDMREHKIESLRRARRVLQRELSRDREEQCRWTMVKEEDDGLETKMRKDLACLHDEVCQLRRYVETGTAKVERMRVQARAEEFLWDEPGKEKKRLSIGLLGDDGGGGRATTAATTGASTSSSSSRQLGGGGAKRRSGFARAAGGGNMWSFFSAMKSGELANGDADGEPQVPRDRPAVATTGDYRGNDDCESGSSDEGDSDQERGVEHVAAVAAAAATFASRSNRSSAVARGRRSSLAALPRTSSLLGNLRSGRGGALLFRQASERISASGGSSGRGSLLLRRQSSERMSATTSSQTGRGSVRGGEHRPRGGWESLLGMSSDGERSSSKSRRSSGLFGGGQG